ncbi:MULTISPECIES: hypothetical protein [unclassified Sphingomonas]|jgi:hypothetical protein|uniref:hypothetical protein n=1 Tax=unclassified Sphingomonas TaxID=196159 RepID=UPI000E10C952|nr:MULTISPECIES: hypothetical protein [unclassified Sphingomonas]AXJ95864.1 hypothetical protein DM480_10430 [Sphingomonas sp. FARSPH]
MAGERDEAAPATLLTLGLVFVLAIPAMAMTGAGDHGTIIPNAMLMSRLLFLNSPFSRDAWLT